LTSIHIFDSEETGAKTESKNQDTSSDSEPAEEEEDSDEELANQAGGLSLDNQIRDSEIPKELTP